MTNTNFKYNAINSDEHNSLLLNYDSFELYVKRRFNIILCLMFLILCFQITTTTFYVLNEHVLYSIYQNNTHIGEYIYKMEKIIDFICDSENICQSDIFINNTF
jgi:hypothetical protein